MGHEETLGRHAMIVGRELEYALSAVRVGLERKSNDVERKLGGRLLGFKNRDCCG